MSHIARTVLGNAVASTLSSSFTATVPNAGGQFSVAAATGWPTANFVVVVDRGLSTEEKILCSSRSGTVCTIGDGGRFYDGTFGYPHLSGAVIEPVLDAVALTALLEHVNTDAMHDHAGYLAGGAQVNAVIGDLAALAQGQSAAAGASGRHADAGHAHPFPAPPFFWSAFITTASNLIVNNTPTTVTGWNAPNAVDTHSGLGASSGRYTIPDGWAGDWRLEAGVEFTANATGYRQILIRKNGVATTGDLVERLVPTVGAAATTVLTVAGLIHNLIPGDYFEVIVTQNSGSSLTYGPSSLSTWFGGRWSRPA